MTLKSSAKFPAGVEAPFHALVYTVQRAFEGITASPKPLSAVSLLTIDKGHSDMTYTTDAARWRALATRDADANGHFVYSVRTTNVYCRPTCPARLARRANVGFYKTSFEAEADGFRACKRCKPNSVVEDPREKAVEKACGLIVEAAMSNDPKAFKLQDLAKLVGLTPRYFHKIFKDKTGLTPKEYAKSKGRALGESSALLSSDASAVGLGMADFNIFDFNNFETLVDFELDTGATLGYNLMTGATQPSAMGFGNAIDVNTLHQMWSGVDAEFSFEDGSGMCARDPFGMPQTSTCQSMEGFNQIALVSEFDAAAWSGCGSAEVMF
jgi:methylphosphotriester-DNA--protein-cysteine methyltransferase